MAKSDKEKETANVAVRTDEQRLPSPRPLSPNRPSWWSEHPLARLRDEMDALFGRFFSRWPVPWEREWESERFWNVDVKDTDKEVVVRAEAPGFEPKEFDIHVSGDTLNIRAEHREEAHDKQEGRRYHERHYARFERSVPLPAAVDAGKAEALYRNGVLELHLPRTEEANRQHIEVKS